MKKAIAILLGFLLLGVAAYWTSYCSITSAHLAPVGAQSVELLWLKKEFHLTDQDFDRIARLHAAYKPHCKEMCRRIDEHNKQSLEALLSTNQITDQVESLLFAGAKLRAECQRDMLRHFYEVSRQMPPAQGKRYLEWVCRQTSVADSGMVQPE